MPLSTPSSRTSLVGRRIECSDFQRDGGLVDVESLLHDVRKFDLPDDWRSAVKGGDPVHELRVRIGGTEGCMYVLALLDAMAPVVIQTVAATRRNEHRDAALSVFDVRGTGLPPLIDTCRSYASSGPIVRQHWPEHYHLKEHSDEN